MVEGAKKLEQLAEVLQYTLSADKEERKGGKIFSLFSYENFSYL